jgi:hypothetical protein
MKKFLVAARIDRGGKGVSLSRINSLVREMEFDGFFETSAKDGFNITELAKAIREAIAWDALPKVSSTELFQEIKAFLIEEKAAGLLLSTADDLYRAFIRSKSDLPEEENLRAQFEACIGRVESRGLIRRLSFGGLGSISEEQVRTGNFFMSENERLEDKEREKLLLIAMVEDLLRYELALREYADDGTYLVFPAQSTRENPNLPNPEGETAIFRFEGPVQNIYATLAVRLSHTGNLCSRRVCQSRLPRHSRTPPRYSQRAAITALPQRYDMGRLQKIGTRPNGTFNLGYYWGKRVTLVVSTEPIPP